MEFEGGVFGERALCFLFGEAGRMRRQVQGPKKILQPSIDHIWRMWCVAPDELSCGFFLRGHSES